MPHGAREIQDILRSEPGLLVEWEGSQDLSLDSPAPLGEAGAKNISFYGDPKQKDTLDKTQAGCLLIPENLKADAQNYRGAKAIVKHAGLAWIKVLQLWEKDFMEAPWGIDPDASIARTAKLGKHVSVGAKTIIEDCCVLGDETKIYPQVYIGKDVTIGANCVIYPQVVIRERCKIGDRVIIHPGVVIGGDGFGYVSAGGKHHKVPQIGTVEIENDVEIGANSAIDRAQMGVTRVGAGTKIDNMVQIGHNDIIGKNCIFAGQVGISGSVIVEDGVILGGQAGVKDHVRIAAGTIVGGQAGVISDIKEKDILWGTPTRNHRESMRLEILMGKLPEIYEFVKKAKAALEKK